MYSVNVKKYNKLSHIEKRASIWAIYIVVNGKGLGVVRKPWWEPNHLDCGEGLMGLGREDLGGLKARGSLGEMEDYIRLLLTTFRTLAHNIKKKKICVFEKNWVIFNWAPPHSFDFVATHHPFCSFKKVASHATWREPVGCGPKSGFFVFDFFILFRI